METSTAEVAEAGETSATRCGKLDWHNAVLEVQTANAQTSENLLSIIARIEPRVKETRALYARIMGNRYVFRFGKLAACAIGDAER